jgi:hypothetical protein
MIASEQFLRFAAECESMAKFTRNPENKPIWRRMAERWVRCAELAERHSRPGYGAHADGRKRHRQSPHRFDH